ncbi:MAG: CinA family protein [Lachnospiraceae bacterium]|nr:CinA family protein [Lachnospiraceae bacterium]
MKIARQVVNRLQELDLSISTAESCTGGMIASELVNIPGVSEFFSQGYVVYSEDAKMQTLGVRSETLGKYTVYSAECAQEMAYGARRKSGSDISVSTTGIAGPDGGDEEHPVGLVYISVAYQNSIFTRKFVFSGDRYQVRYNACKQAFRLILDILG